METRPTRRRSRRLGTTGVAMLAAVAVLASACNKGGDEAGAGAAPPSSQYANEVVSDAAPTTGGRLIYGVPSETSSFNPMLAMWASYSLTVARSLYDNLATFGEDGQPHPDLAESIDSTPDFMNWTVKLRPGVKFTNGKAVDAQTVVALQQAYKQSPIVGTVFNRVASWEIKDGLTFVVHMSKPWSGFLTAMASQVGVIADPAWLDSEDVTHPIGTGPFVVDHWDVNKEMVLKKNPTYWRKDAKGNAYPYLSGITYKIMPDEAERSEALRKGEIDVMMQNYATPTVATLINEARTGSFQAFDDKLFEGPEDYVLTNTSKAPLNDVDARRALATALDLNDYVDTVTAGLDTPADSPWKPGSPWYTPVNYPKFDLAEATRLVDQVKARNGGKFSLTLLGSTSPESTRVQSWLVQQWAKAGIEVKLDNVANQTKIIRMLQGDFDLVLTQQFDNPLPTSDNIFWMNYGLAPNALQLSFARITDPEIGRLSEDAWSSTGEREKEDYNAIAKRLAEIVPYVWLGHASRTVVAKNSVVNVVRANLPDGTPMLQFTQGSHPVHQIWLQR